jgi:beta-glucanase (GH16 family)
MSLFHKGFLRHAVWLALLVAAASLCQAASDPPMAPAWTLVWADEFDRPDGSAPDPKRWGYDIGGGGWGNKELESYTARLKNARIQGGNLIIEAQKETYTGSDGITRDYTSARLRTLGIASWKYGRLEARMQLPRGQGLWPAFWMLGTNISLVSWPACGEIDIMENIGREPSVIHGNIHGPNLNQGFTYQLPGGKAFADDYHLFAVEWSPNQIWWLVDNVTYGYASTNALPTGAQWVFNSPQYLLLNLAVGGTWPGSPDSTTVFPQQLKVDYVRVYAATNAPQPTLTIQTQGGPWQLRWSSRFPQARLERVFNLPGSWVPVVVTGSRSGDQFVESAEPGFYRLNWVVH